MFVRRSGIRCCGLRGQSMAAGRWTRGRRSTAAPSTAAFASRSDIVDGMPVPHARPTVEQMAGYVPGEQPKPGERVIKLNTNENPYPPSPRVFEAIRNTGPEA